MLTHSKERFHLMFEKEINYLVTRNQLLMHETEARDLFSQALNSEWIFLRNVKLLSAAILPPSYDTYPPTVWKGGAPWKIVRRAPIGTIFAKHLVVLTC